MCKNCTKRTIGCHSSCPDYIRHKQEQEDRKRAILEGKQSEAEFYGYQAKLRSDILRRA